MSERSVTTLRVLRIAGVLLVPACVQAQQSVNTKSAVTGVVLAARTGQPLGEARVSTVGLDRATLTDAKGRFRLNDVPDGAWRVVAQTIGHAPDTLTIQLPTRQGTELTFRLREGAVVLDPLVVSGTRELERRSEGSLTVDALSGAQIRETRAAHPSGILNRLAGVHVSETSGEGHMMAMRLKVTTAPMYLYLEDGVPTRATGFFNHNALYEVNLPQAGGIEVIKGPGTALYGSDAIGGIVNVMTRPTPLSTTVELSAEGGANGYRRLLASAGTGSATRGVRADLNVTHSDNWLEEAPFDRISGTIRYDGNLGPWSMRTVIAGSHIDQQDVPAISRGTFDTATTVNLAPIAYRTVRALRVSTAFERESGPSLIALTPYVRINDMGLLPSWQLTYDPQTWETRNTSVGFLARYRRDVVPWSGRIIAGVDADLSPGSYLARQAVVTRGGPYNAWTSYQDGVTHYDYDVTYRGVSPYLQTLWNPVGSLRVDLGLRADFAGYDYTTRLDPVSTGPHRVPASTAVTYSHLSPKAGVSIGVTSALSGYGSYRHGFRIPSFGQLFTQNTAVNTVDLKPVKVDAWEVGLRGQFGTRAVYQVAAYSMTLTDDIITYVTPLNTREARNAGSTRHQGVEASLGLALTPTLRLDVAYAIGRHRYVDWTPQAAREGVPEVTYSGNRIEQAPRNLGNAQLSWNPSLLNGGRVALEWSRMGGYLQDPANTHFYDGHDLLNLHANATVAPRTEVFLRLMNLGDTKYAELSSFDSFQRDTYTPGAPRSLFAGARYAW
jgi:iron complex outermembrane receptor protein